MRKINIFLSHLATEKQVAEQIKIGIEKVFGSQLEIFFSSEPGAIEGGKNWKQVIQDEIKRSHLVLVLSSEKSVHAEWIIYEVGMAASLHKPVIPICHTGMDSKNLPEHLKHFQAIQWEEAFSHEILYRNLLSTIEPRLFESKSNNTQKTAFAGTFFDRNSQWTLSYIGEDQSDHLYALQDSLQREPSESGDGKRFLSGFGYWGIGPTIAWKQAVEDPLYIFMKKAIESFHARWANIRGSAQGEFSYVSLGIGTGEKDSVILEDLLARGDHSVFFPVDMSAEMLRLGIKRTLERINLPRSRSLLIFPIQIDFSSSDNLCELKSIIKDAAKDTPLLVSILGNTISNFDNDTEVLESIASILDNDDYLLVEVAWTKNVDNETARMAADEYKKSPRFQEWVSRCLLHNTNLPAEAKDIEFIPAVEGKRAVVIKPVYRNHTSQQLNIKLASGATVQFQDRETIRLQIIRKYSDAGISALIDGAGLMKVDSYTWPPNSTAFGISLLLLKKR